QYLYVVGRGAEAQPMLEQAHGLAPDNATIAYNLGLSYAKQKKYAEALPLAQQAYAQGFPLPGLKQLLLAAGQWQEPPPAKAANDEAAAAARPASAPPSQP